MPFPTYLQFLLCSSELFLTFRLYKQTSLVPIRCSLVLHLLNDSCCQKCSQLHSWHCIPAVPSALDLAEVAGQIWQETISVKIPPQDPIPCPLWPAHHPFQHRQGDRTVEQGQTVGGSTNCWFQQKPAAAPGKYNISMTLYIKYKVKFLWWHSLSGKGVM